MRLLAVLPFTVLTFLCWGLYGPLLHHGKEGMGKNSLLQFICVGVAYFLIAVVVPLVVLRLRGEVGRWTMTGTIWSLSAGAVGAVGALGTISALTNGGSTVYVMPLIFGGAPVVNTFVSMWMAKNLREAGKIFYTGVLLVALGAAGVMYFRPHSGDVVSVWDLEVRQAAIILASIAITALCWGSYGPVLHKGQMKMDGSRLRPFLCVGLAYFAIAVIVPVVILSASSDTLTWTTSGSLWSLGAGAAGAIGALGIILAFNFGGKPIVVMPLVFGGAPLVNTFEYLVKTGTYTVLPLWFYASLAVVVTGAILVLVFAPRPMKGAKPAKPKSKEKPASRPAAPTKAEVASQTKAEPKNPLAGDSTSTTP